MGRATAAESSLDSRIWLTGVYGGVTQGREETSKVVASPFQWCSRRILTCELTRSKARAGVEGQLLAAREALEVRSPRGTTGSRGKARNKPGPSMIVVSTVGSSHNKASKSLLSIR